MEKETFERLEKQTEEMNSAFVELLIVVQELKQKLEALEEWYVSTHKTDTEI